MSVSAFAFNIPTSIVFQRGAVDRLADLESVRGKRCMLFPYAGFSQPDVVESLNEAALDLAVVDEFEENPTDRLARRLALRAREFEADTLIAIGGGSSIDLAKAVAWFDANPVWRADTTAPGVPVRMDIVAVPTTAGTGSEVSPFTVLTDADTHAKSFVKHVSIIPGTALLDPELTLSVPRRVTSHTGIDALSHSIEGYLSSLCGGMIEPLALESCRLVRDALPSALEDPDDVDARETLLLASLEGGIALSTCGTVFVHALGYRLTQRFGYSHGHANALMLGTFVKVLAELGSDRARRVLDVFDGDLRGFIRNAGVSPDVVAADVDEASLEDWTDSGWNAYGRLNAVVEVSRDDVRAVLCSAFLGD